MDDTTTIPAAVAGGVVGHPITRLDGDASVYGPLPGTLHAPIEPASVVSSLKLRGLGATSDLQISRARAVTTPSITVIGFDSRGDER
ncbi:hypothetical protein OG785_01445 [Streptomyces sp. NBC_00006]|uniref:hypothetical protein n=1 Tax=unclassified Streptomyces TaxID=2593676 RepID=UPI0022583BBF|nr:MULTISPECIES: hypothetical protein [unclassified Streptomyces]MCX4834894.1 hypothetical protein [Streptomyces sp. NBC_01016]MCX5529238.1 hypothetical protein [Streptomyces sp. NBC_00006]